jgi:hypothetical protein
MKLVRLISTYTTNRQIFTPYSTASFTDTLFILRPNQELLLPVGDLSPGYPAMYHASKSSEQ